MNSIFADMLSKGWIVIYMDDILIFSDNEKDHHERTRRVLARLKQHDLYLKPEKCSFDVQEVEFLGLIIHPNHLAMDPTKLNRVCDWKTPTTVTEVQSFIGFANFYRKFINHFSDLARPLLDLTKKDTKWTWGQAQE